MEAFDWTVNGVVTNADDTLPSWAFPTCEVEPRESSTVLASERPTVPPIAESCKTLPEFAHDDVMVSRIHLGPSIDEVLYRLSLGDLTGAALANEELEPCVPVRAVAAVIVAAMQLTYLEEYVLAFVDGTSAWGEILDGSPFSPRETLHALCELVDKGAITLNR
jgi:hypothetical protein